MKPGFKQTDMGMLPDDWNLIPLRDILSTPPKYGINAPAVDFDDTLPRYIRITDISDDGRFIQDKPVSVNHALAENYRVKQNDILLARTGASVGKSYIHKDGKRSPVYAGFLIKVSVNASKASADYVANFFRTGFYWSWVRITSQRSGQPGINGQEYGSLFLPLPPLPEQQAIAAALSDVDALIAAQEALLAKKRAIKQGAMQDLLTGRKRLPGFEGEWEEKRLGDIAFIDQDNLSAGTNRDFTFYYVSLEDVERGKLLSTSEISFGNSSPRARRVVQASDILFSTVRPNLQSHLLWDYTLSPIIASTGFSVIRCHKCYVPHFVYQSIYSKSVSNQIDALLTGSNYPAISSNEVKKLRLLIPPYPEQQAIAVILSDMDAEIEALEAQVRKTQVLKQGMMQELLTGRIRLVPVPEEVA
ncbi:restriction endonuclease subunit S [Deinococcus irradiatisoli]|nr:restriction endonuclease subunit S [Deinococcus irradiatisoli]